MDLSRGGRRGQLHRLRCAEAGRAGAGTPDRAPHARPQPERTRRAVRRVRFHAFFTTSRLDAVTADKTHRGHAIIEQVHADLKGSALAHLPAGKFTANAAWLVLATMAFNPTRAAATLTET